MPLNWKELSGTDYFRGLSPTDQADARQRFFDDRIAPKFPREQRDAALAEFYRRTDSTMKPATVTTPAAAPPVVQRPQANVTTRAAVEPAAPEQAATPQRPVRLTAQPTDTAPQGEPGFMGGVKEFGRGMVAGTITDLPTAAAGLTDIVDQPTFDASGKMVEDGGASQWARETAAAAEARGQDWQESEYSRQMRERNSLNIFDPSTWRGAAYQAGRNMPLSWGPNLAGATLGAVAGGMIPGVGPLKGAAAGYRLGAITALPLFFGQQAKDTYDKVYAQLKAQNPQMTDEQAHDQATAAGLGTGAVEAGGEMVADMVGSKLFRYLPSGVKGGLIKAATKAFQGAGPMIRGMLEVLTAEVGTEMAQQAGEDYIEGRYGVGPGATWESTKSVIMPTMLMTLVSGGAASGLSARARYRTAQLLANPNYSPKQRMTAAQAVAGSIHEQDPELAQLFLGEAERQIAAGAPVIAQDDKFYRDLKPIAQREEDRRLVDGAGALDDEEGDNTGDRLVPDQNGEVVIDEDVPATNEIPADRFARPEDGASGNISADKPIEPEANVPPPEPPGTPQPPVAPPGAPGSAAGAPPPGADNSAAAAVTPPPSEVAAAAGVAANPVSQPEKSQEPQESQLTPDERRQHMNDIGARLKVLRAEQTAAKKVGNEDLLAEVSSEIEAVAANMKRVTNGQAPLPTPREQAAITDQNTLAASFGPSQTSQSAPESPAAPAPEDTPTAATAASTVGGQPAPIPPLEPDVLSATARRLQNRDRNSQASVAQMQDIAANPDPDLLMASPTMESGAPVVSDLASRGLVPADAMGAEGRLTVGKKKVPFRYAVVEADSILASNNADGTRNEGYAQTPDSLTAITNGRTAGLQGAYRRGPAQGYRDAIAAAQSQHGITSERIAAMKAPVLVRLVSPQDVADNIGDASNVGGGLGLSAIEQARTDAGRFDLAGIELTEDGRFTPESLRGFVAAMPATERQTLAPDGEPTAAAVTRMRNAAFFAAYRNPELVREMAQSTDPDAANILNGMTKAAAGMAKLEGAGEYDVRSIVTEAAKRALTAARNGQSLKNLADQVDIDDHPLVTAVIRMFAENVRSAKKIGEKLDNLARAAYAEATAETEDMLGERPKRPVSRLVEENLNVSVEGGSQQAHAGTTQGHREPGGPVDVQRHDGRNVPAERQETAAAGSNQAPRQEEEPAEPVGFDLQPQSEEDLAAQAKAEAGRKKAESEAEAKRKADAERGDFALAGSSRPADQAIARGQNELFGARGEPKASPNTIFTEDAAEQARALLRRKLGQVNTGIDPEIMQAGITLAGYHIEKGARSFSAYAKAMLEDLGEIVRPYLKSWYVAVKLDPRATGLDGMDSLGAVEAVDVNAITEEAAADPINTAAHEAATSPQNDLAHPTEAQIEAENHKMGHVLWNGLDMTIQFPAGTKRNPDWKDLNAHYGHLKRTEAADGEQVDVFINPDEARADKVVVVDQYRSGKKSGGYDEAKVMVGYPDKMAAINAYKGNYPAGWQVGPVTEMSVDEFKAWLKDGDSTKEVASAPADEHAGKWFGSKDKALQYLAKKKIGATHKIAQAGTRFEIRPIAPASAQAYAGETPATENNDAKRPVDQPGAGALAGKPAAAVRPAEEGGGTGTGSAGSGSGNAGGTGNAAGAGAGLASGVGNGAGTVPVSASGAASVGAGSPELDLFGVRGPAAAEAAASPGGRGDAPGLVAPAQLSPDFVITDDVDLGGGGEKTKYRRNIDAIRLLNTLESEGRYATADEQRTLALYVGWGGLQGAFDPNNEKWSKEYAELKELMTPEEYAEAAQSTQYAHYTSKEIIGGIYGALEHMGFTGGNVLEAGGGVGNFIGLMPDAMRTAGRFTLVERERIAAGIAKHLYPQQNVQKADFAAFGRGADGQYDVAAGNPPFSRTALSDQSGRKHLSGLRIHNYFIAKEIDLLRPGGILANVVSNGFLDSADSRARDYIAGRAKFLGAIRLPNNAFSKNAGTEVTTDIVFFQKLPESEWGSRAAKKDAERWTTLGRMPSANGGENIPTNIYFVNNPQMMLGNWGRFGSMYRADQPALVAKPGQNTALDLAARLLDLPANIYQPAAVTGTQNIVDAAVVALNNPTVSEGGFYLKDGKLFERLPDNAGQAYGRELTPVSKWTEKTALGKNGHDRLVALVNLRGTLRSLLAAEMADDQKAMDRLRAQLNTQYDAYAKDTLLNDPGTTRYFGDDPDYPLLASLELDYKPGVSAAAAKKAGIAPFKSSAKKAAIFTRRVVDHRKPVSKADSPQDALNISLAERGVIDADYIGKLLDKDPQSVLEELASGEKPLLFMDPATNKYVLRDEYLSGNVRRKLAQARQSGMMANARALEQVQPEDVGAGEISARIGSPWVPPTIYADFAKSILGEGTKASLQYVPFDSSFTGYIEAGSRVADTSTYGTKDYEASRLIYSMLNNREIKVTYTDSDGKTHTDKEGTELARDKAQEIREKFQDWLFADSDRADVLVRAYNDANNNYVTRVFDGSWLTFPGKVPDEIIKFRRHQRNFVARVMQTRTALADHVVGAGKTYSAIAAAMELKRTGLAKKPMIVVPNHLVKQWATDFYRLYPGANILTATKKDFERVNRRRFLGKIATGDWDAVIIAHSSFNFIKPDPAFEEEFTKAEVKELMDLIAQIEKADDSKENKRKVKQLQSQQERLENKLKSLREKPVDDMLDFEQLGVDQLFVDEAHLFKNLMFSTKMQNIRGLGDAKGSQRAFDMFIKVNETFKKNGRGQGVVFLTGTPVSNSLAEMYHMMRYLMPEQMREAKFWPFDAWANTYASIEETLKPKTSGNGYKTVTAFGAFTNTFELLKMFDQVSDTVTMDDIKSAYSEENGGAEFPLPKVKTGRRQPVAMEMSEAQSAYMEEIARRAEALEQRKGPPQKGEDNHLKVMGDARKAALDVRLVDTTVTEREKGARLDRAAGEIHARYKQFEAERGTQLVFSDLGTPIKSAKKELEKYQALQERINRAADPKVQQDAALGDDAAIDIMNDADEAQAEIDEQGSDWLDGIKAALRGFSVYDDLKAALIERGIPEAQIAFIHDFNTDDQKAGLFRKVNDGTVRVLMGSTPKLGAGTNVQQRLVALHHIDIPWKPSDVEQREGRIIRQGNRLADEIPGFEVEILAYVTKDTLDKNMWDIQERKLRGINQLRSRQISREIENSFDEMEMSASEMQAAATGNVDLLREIQLRNDIQKLERKKRGFDAQRADRDNRRKRAQQLIATLPADIALAEKADAYAKEYRDSLQKMQDEFTVTIDGAEYTDWKKAGLYLREQVDKTVVDDAGKEKPAPLNVTINGEKYTNRTKMTEAFTELRGDADPVIWEIDGTTLRRRNAIEKAIRQRVADALAEQTAQPIGRIGKYDVTIEGDGLEAVNVTMKAPGGIETGMKLSVPKVDPEDAARIAGTSIVRAAANQAINAGEAFWRKNLLKNAQRDLAELGEAGAAAEWPDTAKLESARAEHKEILSRLKAGDEAKKAAREAEAPAPDAAPQFSRSPAARPGHTEATLYEQLRGLFGAKFMDRLFQSGRFRIITNKDAASILGMVDTDALRSGGAVLGFYHRGNGITYLVADSIPAGFTDAQLKGLMRHEIGVHALKAGRDSAGWQGILDEIDRLIDSGDKAAHAAFLRAGAAGTRNVDLLEEVAGYLVEDAPDASIARRIIAWLKEQVFKLTGMQLKLTDADIVAMARSALRRAPDLLAGTGTSPRLTPVYSSPAPIWVSTLNQRIAEQGAKTRTGNDWSAWLQGNAAKLGIKKEEIEWSGITDYLAARGKDKLTTADITDWLGANGVQVQEVTLGAQGVYPEGSLAHPVTGYVQTREEWRDDIDPDELEDEGKTEDEALAELIDVSGDPVIGEYSDTKFEQYQLPGGDNYRELLLTLPFDKDPVIAIGPDEGEVYDRARASGRRFHVEGPSFDGSQPNYIARAYGEQEAFRSSHFEQRNILAHVRFNERTDADGRRVLFLEEIQSDWAQQGRKTGFGYKDATPLTPEEDRELMSLFDMRENRTAAQTARMHELNNRLNASQGKKGTPAAPFVTDTKAWTALALKRMIRYATDNGFDSVAWTTGEQQARRYDLSKQITSLAVYRERDGFKVSFTAVNGGLQPARSVKDADELADTIGKDLAQKAIADLGDKQSVVNYTGLELKVGGEGMRAFYDGIVPQVARDILKKFGGGSVATVDIPQAGAYDKFQGIENGEAVWTFDGRASAQRWASERQGREIRAVAGMPQPGFEITDRMRELASRGMPMFRRSTVRQGRIRRTVDDLVAAAESQADWRDWYKRHEDTLIDLFGEDADLFQKLLSATSQMQTVPGNVTAALKAYKQYLAGEPFTGYLTGVIRNLDRIRNNEEIRGPKIADFQTANAGDERAMAVDRHIAMVFFNTTRPNASQIAAAKTRIITVADRMGWTPRQVQAALWAYNQVRLGKDPSKVRSYDKILEERADFIAELRSRYARGEGGGFPPGRGTDARSQETGPAQGQSEVGALFSRAAPPGAPQRPTNPVQGAMVPPAAPVIPPQQGAMGLAGGATGPGATFSMPGESLMDTVIYRLQDKLVDLKRVQQAIKAAGRQISEAYDAYQKEELFHGRAATRTKEFLEDELDPLVADMRARGVSQEDLGRYLWARHAPEVNARIATINPALPDGGSGMTNAEAAQYMAGLTAQQQADYAALAARVDAITQRTRDVLVNDKLISAQDRMDLQSMYQHYVPLYREDMDTVTQGMGTGQGYSVRGAETRRRTGSALPVVDILGNIANQRDRAIIRGEKARVGRALYALALTNKNPRFWRIASTAPLVKTHDRNGMVVEVPDPMWKQRENVVTVKVPTRRGTIVERAIIFNERDPRAMRMAHAIKNLDGQEMGELLSGTAAITRYFASINTQYNPIFGVTNLLRDVQTAALNLASTPLAGHETEVLKATGSILKGAMRHGFRRFDATWQPVAQEFQEAGGITGYRDVFRTGKERTEAIEKALDPNWWQSRPWGKLLTANGYLKAPAEILVDKGVRPVRDWLSDYNETLENSTRLAAYKVARDMGLSKDASASIAKNLTVNFNRKGEMATQIGSLYAFFNASMQGTARMLQTLKGPAGKYIIAGGVMAGVLQAMLMAAADWDDDEPPQFVRERNFLVPLPGGRYFSLVMPLGFHVLPNAGRLLVEAMRTGDIAKKTAAMMGVLADAFNPLGGSAPLMQIVSPTITDPIAALAMNQDWTGKTIAREDFDSLRPTPGFTRTKDAASLPAKMLAKAINRATGGTDYTKGIASPTPDQIDYLAGQLTGGIGREAIKAATTVSALASGGELPPHRIPLIGRFYGETTGASPQANRFYENIRRLNEHHAAVKGMRQDRKSMDALQYLRDNPEAGLYTAGAHAHQRVQELRSKRRKLIERDANRTELRLVDEQITQVMTRLNQRMREAQQRQ